MLVPAWRLDQNRATLDLHAWRMSLDLSHREDGLVAVERKRDRAEDQHVLGVVLPNSTADRAPIVECYVRGADLVATYAIPELATRVQVYWRAASDAVGAGAAEDAAVIDLQVSVQTDVLDAHPRLSTRSVLAAQRVERLVLAGSPALAQVPVDEAAAVSLAPDAATACLIFPLGGDDPAGGLAYIEMVHPADFRQCRLSRRGESVVVEHELFVEKTLEKGVILRSRVRGMLLRSATSVGAIAADAYERFVAAPPPLTT